MTKVIAFAVFVIGVIALIGFLSFLCAFPTMWLVNYLFAPHALITVFGTGSLSIWQAWALNALVGGFTASSYLSNSKK